MAFFRAATLAAFFLFWPTMSAWAQDVTLLSRDGSVEVAGTLLSYDGEFYRVDSRFGVLTLDASGVICDGPGCPDLTAYVADVVFSGAPTMGDVLVPALVESFAIRNGYGLARKAASIGGGFTYEFTESGGNRVTARFHFRLTQPDEAFADLLSEEADIVLSRREATAAEAERARSAGIGDLDAARHARIVGLDALVPLTPISNRIASMRMEDLVRVFAGEIDNWSHFDGPDEPIALHFPDESSGVAARFVSEFMTAQGLELADGATRHDNLQALAAAVALDPFALGLGSYSRQANAQVLPIVGPCGIPASASARSIKTEDYPLTAPMFVYTPARRLPRIAREFLAFLTSPAAQPVVRRSGFVDQFPESVSLDQQGLRVAAAIKAAGPEIVLEDLQEMVGALDGMRRLTVTFRFKGGSSRPDAQSRSNVELLAEALERGVFDDRRLVFVGFSDGQGTASLNAGLSRARARAVREAVTMAAATLDDDRVQLDIDAFGEAMPMACDEVAWGRRINRRVEVWLE